MSMSNLFIKQDIQDAIDLEPGLKSKNIIVNVENGIITLTGSVENYCDKFLGEKTVKNIRGVRGVVEELQVKLGEGLQRSDEEIAKAAIRALEWDSSLPRDKIKIVVERGAVTLSGEVEWQYQDVKYLFGVKNVVNAITLKPSTLINPDQVSSRILSEFQRSATMDARNIRVETEGSKVILKGTVRSWAEYEEARQAAWSVPGVTTVESNQLHIKV